MDVSQIEFYPVPNRERGDRMPRNARRRSSTDLYHVIARGINKEPIFKQKREKNNFIRLLLKHLKDRDIEIYAYVIMSTHFHILIRVDLKLLSSYLAIVLAEFSEYYNFKHNRNGHVFQDRFKSECVETPQYFWNCIRYIHMNPVNANVVKAPLNYTFSSLKEYETGKSQIIHPKAIDFYKSEFTDFKEFLAFHTKTQRQIFLDIPEEVEIQLIKAALNLLGQEAYLNGFESPQEIIESIEMRRRYKEKLQKELKISKAKTERLYRHVKSCIIGK